MILTFDPEYLTCDMMRATAAWLERHGERRYIAVEPVRKIGPFAVYTVYAGSRVGHPWSARVRIDHAVTAPAIRWVGRTLPRMV